MEPFVQDNLDEPEKKSVTHLLPMFLGIAHYVYSIISIYHGPWHPHCLFLRSNSLSF